MPVSTRDPDEALVRAIAAGEESALASAYDRYGALVYALARRFLRDASAAEEIVQDVFLELWRRARLFDPRHGTLPAFLVTLARSRAIDRLRSRRPLPAGRETSDPERSVDEGLPPLEFASLEDARAEVLRALGTLPSEERHVVELAYFEGLSQSEIAERTGAPLGTVKGRARNALRRLREALPKGLGGER
ncbi:MAG TPA: sigma-70 family RNA polymerase sigma factor [Planctomycetota bacterium]|jgi:RNA polymerase sigma-70 factor (ECF subfamily)|nr:sigma-70 family RNA polymerase sigma factor [Planctomycetota bacterium]